MQKSSLISGAVALFVLISAANANAAEPATANSLQVGGGLNYGIFMGDDEGDPPNPYGIGLGAAAGYTLDFGLYLGGEFNYFFGESKDLGEGVSYSFNVMQFGAEVGYDLGLTEALVLRPKLGLGSATVTAEFSGGGASASTDESGLMIPIGAEVLYSMGGWFLSGQAKYAILNISNTVDDPLTGTSTTIDFNANGLIFGVGAGAAF